MIQALFYQREHENEQFGARDASRSYAIGVDGGGSKTLAVVVDAQGNERGRGIAGSSSDTQRGRGSRASSELFPAIICRVARFGGH